MNKLDSKLDKVIGNILVIVGLCSIVLGLSGELNYIFLCIYGVLVILMGKLFLNNV